MLNQVVGFVPSCNLILQGGQIFHCAFPFALAGLLYGVREEYMSGKIACQEVFRPSAK